MNHQTKKLTEFVIDKLQHENPDLLKRFKHTLSFPEIPEGHFLFVDPIEEYIESYNEFKDLVERAESQFRSIPE